MGLPVATRWALVAGAPVGRVLADGAAAVGVAHVGTAAAGAARVGGVAALGQHEAGAAAASVSAGPQDERRVLAGGFPSGGTRTDTRARLPGDTASACRCF